MNKIIPSRKLKQIIKKVLPKTALEAILYIFMRPKGHTSRLANASSAAKHLVNSYEYKTLKFDKIEKVKFKKLKSYKSIFPDDIPSDREPYFYPVIHNEDISRYAVFENAIVVNDERNYPIALSGKSNLIAETFSEYGDLGKRLRKTLKDSEKVRSSEMTSPEKEIDLAVLLSSQWSHFGHFITEHLLKLRCIEELDLKSKISLLIEKKAPVWKYEILNIMGYESSQIIELNNNLLVRNLVVPSYPLPTKENFGWLRENLMRAIPSARCISKRKLFLSREKLASNERKIVNRDEIYDLVSSYGYEIIYPEQMPISDQIDLFGNAEVIMGPHGSAFSMMFLGNHLKVCEFFGKSMPLAFYRIARQLDFEYTPLYSTLVKSIYYKNKKGGYTDQKIYVDPEGLKKIITKILK